MYHARHRSVDETRCMDIEKQQGDGKIKIPDRPKLNDGNGTVSQHPIKAQQRYGAEQETSQPG